MFLAEFLKVFYLFKFIRAEYHFLCIVDLWVSKGALMWQYNIFYFQSTNSYDFRVGNICIWALLFIFYQESWVDWGRKINWWNLANFYITLPVRTGFLFLLLPSSAFFFFFFLTFFLWFWFSLSRKFYFFKYQESHCLKKSDPATDLMDIQAVDETVHKVLIDMVTKQISVFGHGFH